MTFVSSAEFSQVVARFAGSFHPPVPTGSRPLRVVRLDLTAGNADIAGADLSDTAAFSRWIDLQRGGADFAIGGWGEHRTVYARSAVFDAAEGEEPRRLHLGLDIWGPVGTPVLAPLEGRVHSFANNDAFGDYGATIILEHRLGERRFHALYGHLDARSLEDLEEGQSIGAGQPFARFGRPEENGRWPPHLHWQLILDPGRHRGDYPGVCRYSERERWLENSPAPELLWTVA